VIDGVFAVGLGHDQLVYRSPKPQPDGRTELRLTALELLDRPAALIPPPRLHRLRYHGVPNAPQRPQVTAWARPPTPPAPAPALPCAPHSHPPTHLSSRSKPRELPQVAFASASRAPADSLRP